MKLLERNLRFVAIAFACWSASRLSAAAPVPSVTIGNNFLATTYDPNAPSIPPDANGVIGPRHFVEFINGTYAVFNKTNGQNVKNVTDLHFWTVSPNGVSFSASDVVTDPRIIYDPLSQRWFASMVDANGAASDPAGESNDFLLGVSDNSDPTKTWHRFLFQADPDTGHFADFPTLGVDSNAVYISGDFYFGSTNPIGPGLFSFPKADLLAASPTIANATWSGIMDYTNRGQVLQPAICFDGSVNGKILSVTDIGNDSNPHSNLVTFAVQNAAGPGASLTSSSFIPTASWMVPDNVDFGSPLLTVTQPDGTSALMANDARLSAKVYAVGGVLFAVHNTELNGRIAIRWYRVRAADNVLLESGTISDTNLDLFFPSIAANSYGVVCIAFNGSGPGTNNNVSCFAMAGQTVNGITSFASRLLLQAGATSYHGDDELAAPILGNPPFSRWGDYSATSVDPSDPNRFWTIQMYPSDAANSDYWSTQVTELITTPARPQISLSIQRSGTNVTLSWPSSGAYHPQATPSLTGTVTWSNVTQTLTTNGSLVSVTLPIATGQRYFRLQNP
jgi:hypothetical protein